MISAIFWFLVFGFQVFKFSGFQVAFDVRRRTRSSRPSRLEYACKSCRYCRQKDPKLSIMGWSNADSAARMLDTMRHVQQRNDQLTSLGEDCVDITMHEASIDCAPTVQIASAAFWSESFEKKFWSRTASRHTSRCAKDCMLFTFQPCKAEHHT